MRTRSLEHPMLRTPSAKAEVHPAAGIAGAMLVDPWYFARFGLPGDLAFFGCDLEISRRYGHTNLGAARFIREETAITDEPRRGVYDLGSVTHSDPNQAMLEIADLAAMVTRREGLPVLIGCDHTVSLAGLLGSTREASTRPVYLYFDAHFDLGRNCSASDLLHNGGFVGEMLQRHWVSCAVNVGGRSEATRMDYPPTPRFAAIPADASLGAILQCLETIAGEQVYVSIDADVLDPKLAPNVSCPEPGGLSAETLLGCCQWVGRNCSVVGADLSEVRPHREGLGAERQLVESLLALAGRDSAQAECDAMPQTCWSETSAEQAKRAAA